MKKAVIQEFQATAGLEWEHPGVPLGRRGVATLEPLDRSRRDSTLFQFTSKRLGDFTDPNHLLIQFDDQMDFTKLVAPLEKW